VADADGAPQVFHLRWAKNVPHHAILLEQAEATRILGHHTRRILPAVLQRQQRLVQRADGLGVVPDQEPDDAAHRRAVPVDEDRGSRTEKGCIP